MEIGKKVSDKARKYLALEKSFRVMLVLSIMISLGSSLWEPLLGLYIVNSLGISTLMFGLMSTVQELVSSFAVFPSGFLSDTFGRKNMMLLSIFFSIFSLATLFWLKNLLRIFLVSIFLGLSYAFMGPSQSAYVIDVIPDERRGVAYSTLALFQSLSGIIAISIAGFIAGVFGFYWVFGIALILQFISLVGTGLYLRESLSREIIEIKPSKESLFGQFKNSLIILKNTPLLAVLFGIVFHQLGVGIQSPYLTIYYRNIVKFSLPIISLLLGIQQLGIFLGHFPSGRFVDKYGGEISFAFHIFVTSLTMILFTISEKPFFNSIILFSWGLTFGLDNVSRQKLVAKYRSDAGVATAFGIISLVAGSVSLISPVLGGWIWSNFSPQAVFYTSAAVNIFGSLSLFILWQHNKSCTQPK